MLIFFLGYETEKTYDFIKLVFQNIPNIHTMRASMELLLDVIASDCKENDGKLFENVASTKWLDYILMIINSSMEVARMIKIGHSCLVHCRYFSDKL